MPSEYNCQSLQHCKATMCEVNTNVDEKGRLKVFKKSDPRVGNHWDRACIVRHNHDGKNKILKRISATALRNDTDFMKLLVN